MDQLDVGFIWECGCSLSCGAEEQWWEGEQEVHGVVNTRKRGCRSSMLGLSSLYLCLLPGFL